MKQQDHNIGVAQTNIFVSGSFDKSDNSFQEFITKLPGQNYISVQKKKTIIEANEEEDIKNKSNYLLYVINTLPDGFDTIIDLVDNSNNNPGKTIYLFIENDKGNFTSHQIKSLRNIGKTVKKNGAQYFESYTETISHLTSNSDK